METRCCSRCRQILPHSAFGRDNSRTPPLNHACKSCAAARQMDYRSNPGPRRLGRSRKFTDTTAVCSRCGRELPKEDFARIGTQKVARGCGTYCRECAAAKRSKQCRTFKGIFAQAQSSASRRGIAWHLCEEEFRFLRLFPCHYCGGPLPETGCGLDRLDNTGCYEIANVVSCCTICNLSRNSILSPDEMLVMGKAVALVFAGRAARGIPRDPDRGWGSGAPRKYARVGHD